MPHRSVSSPSVAAPALRRAFWNAVRDTSQRWHVAHGVPHHVVHDVVIPSITRGLSTILSAPKCPLYHGCFGISPFKDLGKMGCEEAARCDPEEMEEAPAFPRQPIYDKCPLSLSHRVDDPKGEIRLLGLLPGKRTDDIHCELFTTPVSEAPKYCYLSYQVGDATVFQPTRVNGKLMGMPENLYLALKRSLLPTKPTFYFVDTLCINNINNDERAWHVVNLGAILSFANALTIWVGEEGANTHGLFKFLGGFLKRSLKAAELTDRALKGLTHIALSPYWTQLHSLLSSCLFAFANPHRHVWLRCGSGVADMLTFMAFIKELWQTDYTRYRHLFPQLDTYIKNRTSICRFLEYGEPTPPFWVLSWFSMFQVAAYHDRIFSLYALLETRKELQTPKADFTQDNHETTLISVDTIIRRCGDLSFFFTFGRLAETTGRSDIPTWIPDFATSPPSLFRLVAIIDYQPFGKENLSTVRIEEGVLFAAGKVVSRVNKVMGPLESRSQILLDHYRLKNKFLPSTTFEAVNSAAMNRLQALGYSVEAAREKFFSMITQLRDVNNNAPYPSWYHEAWDSVLEAEKKPSRLANFIEKYGKDFEWRFKPLTNHCFIGTKAKPCGLGPRNVKNGDLVCVLYGCRYPIVLRQSTKGCHTVVGPAYLEGVMKGEFAMGGDVQTFKLV